MKHTCKVLFLTIFLAALIFEFSTAQTIWTKDTLNNPVLDTGTPGSWDDISIGYSYVIDIDTDYHMWYSGYCEEYGLGRSCIGHAISENGIEWIKDTLSNPVIEWGPIDSWNSQSVTPGPVIIQGDTIKMWYCGGDYNYTQTGLATSTDGITWTLYDDSSTTLPPYSTSDPVLFPGLAGSFDDQCAVATSILLEGDLYRMWYLGYNGLKYRTGYATSSDGIHWIKDSINNPVLKEGPPGSWDDIGILQVQVIHSDENYKMWYEGWGDNYSSSRTGYAKSPDGIDWTKNSLKNPVLDMGPAGSWDDQYAFVSCVLFDDSTYKMWYVGHDGLNFRLGYATSKDQPNDIPGIEGGLSFPSEFVLYQNFPNPFNSKTIIRYQLPVTTEIELGIYNLLGQKLVTLVSGKQRAGSHRVEWDASGFASGVYFYRIATDEGFVENKKLIFLK